MSPHLRISDQTSVSFVLRVALFSGPAQLLPLAEWKSGRGPEIIYHIHVLEGQREGREDLIEHRWIIDVHTHVHSCKINNTHSCVLVGAHSDSFQTASVEA